MKQALHTVCSSSPHALLVLVLSFSKPWVLFFAVRAEFTYSRDLVWPLRVFICFSRDGLDFKNEFRGNVSVGFYQHTLGNSPRK